MALRLVGDYDAAARRIGGLPCELCQSKSYWRAGQRGWEGHAARVGGLQFQVTRYWQTMRKGDIADDASAPRLGELRYESGKGNGDPVLRALTLSILPVLDCPAQANHLFVDHVMLAVGFHVGQVDCSLDVLTRRTRGLAPWRKRRAKEYIDANLDGRIPLAELVRECGLSTSQFSRAFQQTTRTSPHRWLLPRRLENAR